MRAHANFPPGSDRGTSIVIERREYYEEPRPSRNLTRPASKPSARGSYPPDPFAPTRDEIYRNESYPVEGGRQFYEVGTDGTPRGYRLRDASRSRSRSHYSIDEGKIILWNVFLCVALIRLTGAESDCRDRLLSRAPSPARLRQRSPTNSRSASSKVDSDAEVRGRRTRSRTSSRYRHRSEDRDGGQRRDSPPADDYDWYDKDGMRIRVREI